MQKILDQIYFWTMVFVSLLFGMLMLGTVLINVVFDVWAACRFYL